MSMESSLISSFRAHSSHVEGCQIDIASNEKQLVSVGADDALCIYTLNSEDQNILSINNNSKSIITSIAIHPFINQTIVIGTKQGYVILVNWDADVPQVNLSNIIYKTSNEESQNRKIKQLSFSQNGKFLYIVASQNSAIVYDFEQSKFYKKQFKKEAEALTSIKDYKNQFFVFLDMEGFANIFRLEQDKVQMQDQSQSEDPFASLNHKQSKPARSFNIVQIASYIISNQNISRNNIYSGCFSNQNGTFLTETLYLPGRTTLQKVQITLPPSSISCDFGVNTLIYLQKQILNICWLKNDSGVLLTSNQKQLIFWHQKFGEKIININFQVFGLKIVKLVAQQWRGIDSWGVAFIAEKQGSFNGNVYQFINNSQLLDQVKKINLKAGNKNNYVNQIELRKQQIQNKEEQTKKPTKKHQIYEESKAHKMLPVYPQLSLQPKFQQYNNARFLYCNNVGCIIQRSQGNQLPQLQLQFHDKSHYSRIKLSSQIQYCYFALSKDTLVYASLNHVVVQNQKFLKENNFSWEAYGKDLQGVAIGGQWIAVAFKYAIRIYDLVGNQINNIQFDRPYVTMAAYQDHLALVYHSALPLWGVMSLKMNLYTLSRDSCKLIKTTTVPLKPNSRIKWFGFSQQGAIFSQDQHQNLRVYSYEKDEWTIVFSLDSHTQKLFIQHIQGYQIYGFRLNQNPPQQPRVMPRSYPRKIFFDLGNYKADYLTQSQNNYVKQHKLKLLWIQNEKYRNKNWSKYKYSRGKNNPLFARSETIKSEQDIKAIQAQTDIKLLSYLTNYIKTHRESQRTNKYFWQKILGLCQPLAIFKETRNKLRESLRQNGLIGECVYQFVELQNPQINYIKKTKINQLSRLEQMMSLQWAQTQSSREMNQSY